MFKIAGRKIGVGEPVYVIAELSANHNHDYAGAVALVKAAKDAGADAVKLQTYTADTMTIDCDAAPFRIGEGTLWSGQKLYDLYLKAYTPWEWHRPLKEEAKKIGLHLFSTPFDTTSVDFLQALDMPAYKIASFELVDIPLIERAARTGKPLIMSTGMATLDEIHNAVDAAAGAGAKNIALLKCTSAYPSPPELVNLRAMPYLKQVFRRPVGLSDHTLGTTVAVASVALGACIIEKHLTLSRSTPGPDSAFSLEPAEFAEMVAGVRTAEKALGNAEWATLEGESPMRALRRSLFVVQDVAKGEVFTNENVRSIRPADGMPPTYLPHVLGKTATVGIKRGTPLSWDLVGIF